MSEKEWELCPLEGDEVWNFRPSSGQTGSGRGLKFRMSSSLGYPNLSLKFHWNRVKFFVIRRVEILFLSKIEHFSVGCPQTPQPISETAGYFWAEFSRDVRVGIGGRHYCFRIFNFVSIDPGKIVKVIDCLKNCHFSYIFGPPAARGQQFKISPTSGSSSTHTPPDGIYMPIAKCDLLTERFRNEKKE